jgi:hypothetical protein
MSKITEECPICIEPYTLHPPVRCEYCPIEACRSCCERYILCKENKIKCMDTTCTRLWTRRFINKHFTQKFINGKLQSHRENILFENEKEFYPDTIDKIAKLKTVQDDFAIILSIMEIKKTNKDITMYDTLLSIYDILFGNVNKVLFKIERTMNYVDVFIIHISYHIEQINSSIVSLRMCDDINKKMNEQNARFQTEDDLVISKYRQLSEHIDINRIRDIFCIIIQVIQCRDDNEKQCIIKNYCHLESCEGILDDKWYCVLCGRTTCPMCLEKKDDENHTCNKDTVESVKMMKTETKPCPRCKARIYKIDGCDQMWCTRCHTAFSWTTGNIERRIHNPHYYEWLRSRSENGEIPRTDGDGDGEEEKKIEVNHCDDEIEITEFHTTRLRQNVIMYIKKLRSIIANKNSNANSNANANSIESEFENIKKQLYHFESELIHIIHLREFELRKYSDVDNNNDKLCKLIVRLNYLNKKINEKEYKTFLGEKQTKKEMNVEMRQLIQTWIVIKTDVLRRFIYRFSDAVIHNQIIEFDDISYELDEIKSFVNTHLREIEKIYKVS